MKQRKVCVYNLTRECFLSLGVTVADTSFSRLRGLIGKTKMRPDDGIWLIPSSGVHTIGVLFAIDLLYLDQNHRVIETIESFPRFHVAPMRIQAASVLELPTHTVYPSQTQTGDEMLICPIEEVESRLRQTDRGQIPADENNPERTSGDGRSPVIAGKTRSQGVDHEAT